MKKWMYLLGIFASGTVFADDVVQTNGAGGTNWTKGYVFATGYGTAPDGTPDRKKRILARRAAQVDAYRQLAEQVSGVRVTSETIVKDMVSQSDTVKTKISAVVKGARMTEQLYENEVATVTLKMPLDGGFMEAVSAPSSQGTAWKIVPKEKSLDFAFLLNSLFKGGLIGKAHASDALAQPTIVLTPEELKTAKRIAEVLNTKSKKEVLQLLKNDIEFIENHFAYTGLLIDASKVNDFELATIPNIRDEKGEIIYPIAGEVDGESLKRMPVSYDFDVADAIRNERVAMNPMIVPSSGTYKSRKSDLVIPMELANLIRTNPGIRENMLDAGVMVVIAK